MGLAVEVGMLADLIKNDEEGAEWLRESFAGINEVLAAKWLPAHHEPETLLERENRAALDSFPYSFLHNLRRAYARMKQAPGSPLDPCADGEDPADDPAVEAEYSQFQSHLVCHSDCEGFYLPISFDDVL